MDQKPTLRERKKRMVIFGMFVVVFFPFVCLQENRCLLINIISSQQNFNENGWKSGLERLFEAACWADEPVLWIPWKDYFSAKTIFVREGLSSTNLGECLLFRVVVS